MQLELVAPSPTTMLINNSPVTVYHSLVVPDRAGQHSQLLTSGGVRVAFELLLRLPDRRYRIGYNSPGAQASVNHLHLHLLRIDTALYVQRAVGIGTRLTHPFKLFNLYMFLVLFWF